MAEWLALGALLTCGCRNVETPVDADQSGAMARSPAAAAQPAGAPMGPVDGVFEGSPGSAATAPDAEPIATAAATASEPQPNGDIVGSSSEAPAEQKTLEVASSDWQSAETACRVWLDRAPSELLPEDLRVTFRGADEAPVEVPFTAAESCTSARALGSAPPDAGRSDAGTPEPGDAATPAVDSNPVVVNLALEGWFLGEDVDGLWLEFCPNACHTVLELGGVVEVEAPAGIGRVAAR
jgi:hypothetical protein